MDEPIKFYSKSKEYSEFSNFHEAQFELDGTIWKTVEHYFQYQKFPGDASLQERIFAAETPAIAKRLGRTKSRFFREDWNEQRDVVMKQAVLAKFQQNPPLQKLLFDSYPRPIIFADPNDAFWGYGRTKAGQNKLGRMLMDYRNTHVGMEAING